MGRNVKEESKSIENPIKNIQEILNAAEIKQNTQNYNNMPLKTQGNLPIGKKNIYQDSLDVFQKEYNPTEKVEKKARFIEPKQDVYHKPSSYKPVLEVNEALKEEINLSQAQNEELVPQIRESKQGSEHKSLAGHNISTETPVMLNETPDISSKGFKKNNMVNSYSMDIVGGRLKNNDREEKRVSQRYGRGKGLKYMFENPELLLQTNSMFIQKTANNEENNRSPNIALENYFRMKDMMSKRPEVNKKKEQGKADFFLGAPRYYPKEKHFGTESIHVPSVKYYSVKALKNLDNVPLP